VEAEARVTPTSSSLSIRCEKKRLFFSSIQSQPSSSDFNPFLSKKIKTKMEDVPESKDFSFPRSEERTLTWWDSVDAFEEQLRRTKGGEPFVFYDGPPFATGLPHYGHLLAGTIKVKKKSFFFPSLFLAPFDPSDSPPG
jgi:hypothetical protein